MKLLKFSGSHCPQCKAYQRILDKFKTIHPEIEIEEINAEENQELVERYNIMSLPTTVFLGKSEKVIPGILTLEKLESNITND